MKSINFYQNLKWKKYSFHIKFPKHDAIKNDFFFKPEIIGWFDGKKSLEN